MRCIRKRDHVRIMAVHAAVGNQAEQMKPVSARSCEALLQYPIARQFSALDRFVNSGQVLIHDPAGAQIEVANFGIAHLCFR